jgi:hypothetical protein
LPLEPGSLLPAWSGGAEDGAITPACDGDDTKD